MVALQNGRGAIAYNPKILEDMMCWHANHDMLIASVGVAALQHRSAYAIAMQHMGVRTRRNKYAREASAHERRTREATAATASLQCRQNRLGGVPAARGFSLKRRKEVHDGLDSDSGLVQVRVVRDLDADQATQLDCAGNHSLAVLRKGRSQRP